MRASLAVAAIACIGGFLWWAWSNNWGNDRHLRSIQAEKRTAEGTVEPEESLAAQNEQAAERNQLPGGNNNIFDVPPAEHDKVDTSSDLEAEPRN